MKNRKRPLDKKLSDLEAAQLKRAEALIAHDLDNYLRTCAALREIRDRALFRDGYPSWDAYCQAKLNLPAVKVDDFIELGGALGSEPETGRN